MQRFFTAKFGDVRFSYWWHEIFDILGDVKLLFHRQVPTLMKDILHASSEQKKLFYTKYEEKVSFGTFVPIYQTTQCLIQQTCFHNAAVFNISLIWKILQNGRRMVRETGKILRNFSYHIISHTDYFCSLFCTDKQRIRIKSVLKQSSDLGIVT